MDDRCWCRIRVGKAGMKKYTICRFGAWPVIRRSRSTRSVGSFELERTMANPDRVGLTIDLDLQKMISKRLGGKRRCRRDGCSPRRCLGARRQSGFDPNIFNRAVRRVSALVGDTRALLTNKAVGGQYAPGSTFKMCGFCRRRRG